MKKSYYEKFTLGELGERLGKALAMIENYPVDEVVFFLSVPKTVIVRACRETGKLHHLKNTDKISLYPQDFYDRSDDIEGETRDERAARIHQFVFDAENNHEHSMYHVRCAKCMKILGSEKTYTANELVLQLLKESIADRIDLDESLAEPFFELGALFADRLQKI